MTAATKQQPMQPLYRDDHGTIRFQPNKLVRYLLDNGGIDMNDLAIVDFPQDDREQFAQLIGYSLSGYSELSYVREESVERADSLLAELDDAKATGQEPQ